MKKNLILLRGLPGSGKSTLAKVLQPSGWSSHYEADMYFMKDGEYKFDPSELRNAHSWCQDQTRKAMEDNIPTIFITNTFTQEWEMKSYYELAEKYGYTVYSIISENRHNGVNVHNVPEDKLKIMKERFEIKL
jgi:predicted kinase